MVLGVAGETDGASKTTRDAGDVPPRRATGAMRSGDASAKEVAPVRVGFAGGASSQHAAAMEVSPCRQQSSIIEAEAGPHGQTESAMLTISDVRRRRATPEADRCITLRNLTPSLRRLRI